MAAKEPLTSHVIDSVRLSDFDLKRIMDGLDAADECKTGNVRRRHRYPLRTYFVVQLHQPGSTGPVAFKMPTRKISAGGVSLLHGGFVHTGTCWVVQMNMPNGTSRSVRGMVAYCRHLEGRIHELGVALEPAEKQTVGLI